MNINVQFISQLKTAAGIPSVTVDLADGSTMKDLARTVSAQFGPPLKAMIIGEDGNPRSGVLVFSGDDQVDWDAPANTDQVTFMSAIAGG